MAQPDRPLDTPLAEVAGEDPAESLAREREVLGDQPDTGDLVSPDHSQSAPARPPCTRPTTGSAVGRTTIS